MSIGISDEHVELASSLRKWAADLRGRELTRDVERHPDATFAEIWAGLTAMGVPTIGLPEAAGGGGGTPLDVAVALEACAHELVPGPLLGPAVAAAVLGRLPEGAVVGIALDGVLWDAPSATHVLADVDGR
jgi:3-oxochol-4-en-24-oyl-CoA dehydrogenase